MTKHQVAAQPQIKVIMVEIMLVAARIIQLHSKTEVGVAQLKLATPTAEVKAETA
jgi:hypothetical protein